jgi:hypothetical protein
MTDLKTLQYPRAIHKGGAWKLVSSPSECDAAMDEGWVLRPGDESRQPPVTEEPETATEDTVADEAAESDTSDAPAKKKSGRPKKSAH